MMGWDTRGSIGNVLAPMIRLFVEKGIPVQAAPVQDSSGIYLFGREWFGWGWVLIERILIPEVGCPRAVGRACGHWAARKAGPLAGVKSRLANIIPENLHISVFFA